MEVTDAKIFMRVDAPDLQFALAVPRTATPEHVHRGVRMVIRMLEMGLEDYPAPSGEKS